MMTWSQTIQVYLHRDEVVMISSKELQWLLEGFDIWKQPPHQTLNYSAI